MNNQQLIKEAHRLLDNIESILYFIISDIKNKKLLCQD